MVKGEAWSRGDRVGERHDRREVWIATVSPARNTVKSKGEILQTTNKK